MAHSSYFVYPFEALDSYGFQLVKYFFCNYQFVSKFFATFRFCFEDFYDVFLVVMILRLYSRKFGFSCITLVMSLNL